jgi:hypothetical protein
MPYGVYFINLINIPIYTSILSGSGKIMFRLCNFQQKSSAKTKGLPTGTYIPDIHKLESGIRVHTGCIMKNLWCYNFLIFYPILTNDTSNKIVLETL